ncbi:MAG: sulfate transporter [Hyphomicrobiales bacterium]|nr:MAG: sulfate transporter [Hyphomicrobiales bacterium]
MKTLARHIVGAIAALGLAASAAAPALAADSFITVASTTSTANSGLFDSILPVFQKKTGIEVRVVAVGTGAAIRLARSGDADVLLVHHKKSEEQFVADGFGVKRYPLMFNDFVIVGPKSDPAGVKGEADVAAALNRIADSGSMFASRGDDSGTHKRERELWKAAGIDPVASSGKWYRETGSGMGATLNVAAGSDAYALTDRGTWLSFANRGDLELLVSGDTRLRNEYGAIVVSKDKFPHVKADLGQKFADWMLSREGQAAINGYKINGEQLFYGMVENPTN